MMRLKLFGLILLVSVSCTFAQDCKFGSPDAADELEKALQRKKTCQAAADLLNDCRWGSSADSAFSAIVVGKCEDEFLNKLSPGGMDNYTSKMQLCAYEYARQEGTISISEAATCQVDVAREFAVNTASNNHAPPIASFDCAKAQTILERAICSDIRLGHADIVLTEVYGKALRWVGPHGRASLVGSERKWLGRLAAKCEVASVPLTEKQINCLRNEIEIRFSLLDTCGDGEDISDRCASFVDDPANVDVVEPLQVPARASFDCDAPKTAIEIVICADSELGQKDLQLARAYNRASERIRTVQHEALVESERKWLGFVRSTCPLGVVGGIPSVMTRACVRSAFEMRISQLGTCLEKPAGEQISCLNNFQLMEK